MNELTSPELANADTIRSRILTIRGVQVMLDRDLAELYGVTTGALNQAVKRNKNRFPERFMFQLTKEMTKKETNTELEITTCDFKFEWRSRHGDDLEITICDIKLGRLKILSVCFHRTGRCHAFKRTAQ